MNRQNAGTTEESAKAVIVLSVTEVTTSRFPVAAEVPAAVAAGGPEAVAEYIATAKDVQLDELPAEEEKRVFMSVSTRDANAATPQLQAEEA